MSNEPKSQSQSQSQSRSNRGAYGYLPLAASIFLALVAPVAVAQGGAFGDQLFKQLGQAVQGAIQPKPEQPPSPVVQPQAPPARPDSPMHQKQSKQRDASMPSSVTINQDQQTESLKKIPLEIKTVLDKKYPEWMFATVSKSMIDCEDNMTNKIHPFLGMGDFNGDGKTDYAMGITRDGKLHVLEFLSKGNVFSENLLFKRASVKIEDIALMVERKGKSPTLGTIESVDTVNINGCGGIGLRYVFRNGRIRNESPRD